MGLTKRGATRHEEVLEQLARADTGLQSDRLFLGPWRVSHWAFCWIAGVAVPGASAPARAAAGDCRRVWQTRALIVAFDERGVVQKVRQVSDRELGQELQTLAAASPKPPLDLSCPIYITAGTGKRYRPAELTLARDIFALAGSATSRNIRVTPPQLLSLSTLTDGSPRSTKVETWFRDDHGAVRRLRLHLRTAGLLALFEYFVQTRSGARPGRK